MTANNTYRAAVARRFGGPEVLSVEELTAPPLPAGGVRVAVRVGGVNPVDARIRSGSFGGRPPFVPGTEFAGVVVEVARGVAGVHVGDEVVGFGTPASNADLVTTSADRIVPRPRDVPWELAGAVGAVGQTALTILDALELPPTACVLVHGGSGGVGTMLLQFLAAAGNPVVATAGTDRADHIRTLGATPVTYGPGLESRLAEDFPDGFDASIDLAGTPQSGDIGVAIQKAGGAAISITDEVARTHGIRFISAQRSQSRLSRVLRDAGAGILHMPVTSLPLNDIVEIHRILDTHHAVGKTVVDLSDNPHLPQEA